MAIDTSLQGRDLCLKRTDEKGLVTHSEHRVWDPGLFMEARLSEARALNAKHGSTLASAEQITREQYAARA